MMKKIEKEKQLDFIFFLEGFLEDNFCGLNELEVTVGFMGLVVCEGAKGGLDIVMRLLHQKKKEKVK